MHAEVHNTTTPGMHRYHYKMHLEYEGAYDVDLDGRLEGPVTDIVIHTAIDFRAMTKPVRIKISFNKNTFGSMGKKL